MPILVVATTSTSIALRVCVSGLGISTRILYFQRCIDGYRLSTMKRGSQNRDERKYRTLFYLRRTKHI